MTTAKPEGLCVFTARLRHEVHERQFKLLARCFRSRGVTLCGYGMTGGLTWDGEPREWPALPPRLAPVALTDAAPVPPCRAEWENSPEFAHAADYCRGALHYGDPTATYVMRACARYWQLALAALRPSHALVWNGGDPWEAALGLVARSIGCSVQFIERGPLPGTLQMDPQGINGGSAFADSDPEDLPPLLAGEAARLEAVVERVRTGGVSAWQQPEAEMPAALRRRLGVPEGARVMFVPGQVDEDTNLIYYSPLFRTTQAVVDFAASVVREHEDWWLVVKPHPKASHPVRIGREMVRTVLCEHAHVHSLVRMADLVGVINSSVGVEARLFDKPVIQFGKGLLSRKGLYYEVGGLAEATERLHALLEADPLRPAGSLDSRNLFALVCEHLYDLDGPDAESEAERFVEVVLAETPAELSWSAEDAFMAATMFMPTMHDRAAFVEMFTLRELLGTVKRRILNRLRGLLPGRGDKA